MDFGILGQVIVATDAGSQTDLAPIPRRMLAALLAAGARGLSPVELMQAVWGDAVGRENTMKSHASRLRALLGARMPQGGAGGYRIHLTEGDRFDVAAFRRHVEAGMAARSGGELAAAAAAFRAGLDLWGLPPLPDLLGRPAFLAGVRAALLAEQQAALVALYEVRLELGQHEQVAAELRREVLVRPGSETLHQPLYELLMTALHRAGERSEALRTYDMLAEQLKLVGGEPGALLRELRDEILADARSAAPPPAEDQRGGLPVPAQLPPGTPDFTGRDDEVGQMVELLAGEGAARRVPIVAVSGPPGVGKSALAVEVAHQLRGAFPDGQVYAHLAGMSRARDTVEVLGEMLGAFGVPAREMPATSTERSALLRSLLAGRRVLVVLDDAASMHQVQPFLPGMPGCAVIVTSRSLLAGPGVRPVTLEPFPDREAEQLLAEIVGVERVVAEPEAAGQVLEMCGGFPLAVRIVASRLSAAPHWQMSYLAGRLADRAKLLDTLQVGDMAMAASIAMSYEALPEEAQHAYRMLALAGPGDFPAWLVALLLGEEDAEEVMQTLLMRSLVTAAGVDAAGQPRYRQHDLLREYSAARLAEHEGERELGLYRLLMGWLELVDRADSRLAREPYYPPPPVLGMREWAPAGARALVDVDPVAWWDASISHVLGVIRLAAAERRYHIAAGVALRTASYLYRQSRDRDALDMWRTVMHAAADAGDERRTIEARHRVASLVSRLPDGDGLQRAVDMLDECVAVASRVVDRRVWSRSLSLRAYCRYKKVTLGLRGREWLDAAAEDAEQGVKLAQVMDDEYSQFTCLRVFGLIQSWRGDYERAQEFAERAVEVAHRFALATGERGYETFATRGLVKVVLAAGKYEKALELARHGRSLAAAVGHQAGEAGFGELAGDALAALGRRAEAGDAFEEAAALYLEAAAQARCRYKSAAARGWED